MLRNLKALLDRYLDEEDESGRDHELEVATAALLLATVRADFQHDENEAELVLGTLRRELHLDEEEAQELAELANREVDRSVSLYDFTRVVNDRYGEQRKTELVEMMWRVALADGRLEKHEEFLIRKVAGLIYVPHSQFIAAKLRAQQQSAGD